MARKRNAARSSESIVSSESEKRQETLPANVERQRTNRNGAVMFALIVFILGFVAAAGIAWAASGKLGMGALAVGAVVGALAANSIHLLMEWERAVIMRLGKYNRTSGPGVVFTFPIVEFYSLRVDQRVATTYFGAEETLTSDLVPINVDAVLFWMVFSPQKAAIEVEDYASAVQWVAQTAMRKAIGRNTAAQVAQRRDEIDDELKAEIEEKLNPWGIDIIAVEVRDLRLPKELQEAMAAEAMAERRREARLTLAEAERDISDMLTEAADSYGDAQAAMRLRTMHLAYESVAASGGTVVLPSNFAEGFVDSKQKA